MRGSTILFERPDLGPYLRYLTDPFYLWVTVRTLEMAAAVDGVLLVAHAGVSRQEDVRSAIDAEKFKLSVEEASAKYKQLVAESALVEESQRAQIKSSELNRHPAAGYEILRPIKHPFADIPLMARYHHERPDGRGYPDGLKDEEIPLGAKIVSLADSFDAMTTDRPYRRRRSFVEVLADFRRNAGKQFSPPVVEAFCRALLKEARGHTRPRQIIRLLGKDYVEESALPALEQLISDLESGTHMTAGQA